MSEGILKFNLPEEREEFELAVNAFKLSITIDELDNWLRGLIKYSGDDVPEQVIDTYQKVRDKLWELKGENV